MTINLHVLDISRPDLTDLVPNIVELHSPDLAGTIRVDYFSARNGSILGSHLFYLIFREPGSIGFFTAFVCGAGSGNFSYSAQVFKRLMDTLWRCSSPFWSLHPHSESELYQLFGAVQNLHGVVSLNTQAMQGFHPGQYQTDFLDRNEQFSPAIETILGNLSVPPSVHEAFLSTLMANYGLLWSSLYGVRS